MQQFKAISNSTIYDVCLNTYGTLDLLVKLMDDNDFDGVDTLPENGQIFLYDETLVKNVNSLNLYSTFTSKKYATQ